MWTEEQVSLLIELYKQHPILWDIRHKNYKNRNLKNDALKAIGETMNIEVIEVERKINVVLAQYRKTRNKVLNLRKSGIETDEIEKNIWYGYKLLQFLEDRFNSIKSKTSSGLRTDEQSQERLHERVQVILEEQSRENAHSRKQDVNSSYLENDLGNTNIDVKSQTGHHGIETIKLFASSKAEKKRKKAKVEDRQMNEVFALMKELIDKKVREDEYSLYGEQIALKLKRMDSITRAETQYQINCILYEAEMKMLRQSSS